jgi:hypothetical protein
VGDVFGELAARQDDVIAVWQLREAMSRAAIRHRTRALRELRHGVFLIGHAPPNRRRQMWAAALSAPGRVISHASAGHAYGFRPWAGAFDTVSESGSGGPRRLPSLLVCRTSTLRGNTTALGGLPITTAERALADLAPGLDDRDLDRATREALRLGATTCARIHAMLAVAGPRNRPRRLARLAGDYARLPIARARSDAEAYAVAILDAAGRPLPALNVRIAGHRADLSWRHVRHIVELDGPDFHQFPDHDLEIQQRWERAGWTVDRLPTGDVYDLPTRLLAIAPTG